MSRKPNTRQHLLEAAQSVAAKSGAAHLTLDAVAAAAGVSKGGLLYHFPTKEALIQAMLERLLRNFDADQSAISSQIADGPATPLLAHIRAGLRERPEQRHAAAALLAAGANDPKLLDPVRAWHARNFENLARSHSNPSRAAAVMLAIDGLWLHELLETSPLSSAERLGLQAELEALALAKD